jgi:hypothetical protein
MSSSVSVAASGVMSTLLRTRARKSWSCSAMYVAFCPARFGHSGLVLFPFAP